MRGYAGEEKARGGNVGLFWRFIKVNSLFGANAFLDYERDENAGGFWRWSFGAEWKNKYGELSANSYWRITDGKQQADGFYYTREGFDADLYLRAPGLEWAALRGGYYRWEGERGDGDDEGFRYGLRLSPGGGVFVEAEYDEDSGDFGGSFSYTHTFGEASAGAEKAGGFNPRLHFYDSARREYSQRISRAGVGGSEFAAVLVSSNLRVNVGTVTIAAATTPINYNFPLISDVSITTGASGNEAFFRQQGGGWNLTLNATSTVAILQTARVLNVIAGDGEFERFGNDRLQTVIMPGVILRLLGTRFSWDIGASETKITLHEGGVSIVDSGAALALSVVAGARAIVGGQTVGCGAGQAASGSGVSGVSGVSADCASIFFAGTPLFSLLMTTEAVTIGTVAISGGDNPGNPDFAGAANGFSFVNDTVLIIADAANAGRFTTTVRARDSHLGVADVFLTASVTLFSLRIMTVTNTVTTGFSGVTVYEGNITATARRVFGEANPNRLIWLSPVEQTVTAVNGMAVFTGERNTHGWVFPRYVGGGSPPYDAASGELDLVPRTVTVGNLTVTETTTTVTATVAPGAGFFGMLQSEGGGDFPAVAVADFEKSIVIPAKVFVFVWLCRHWRGVCRFRHFSRVRL